MVESPTANFSGSEQALFSPTDIRQLMRAEYERAGRYGHSLTCLLVGVDRLEPLTDLYGFESRQDVLDAVIELLLARLRVGDLLGCREDDDTFLLALPFTPPVGSRALSQRLLAGAREFVFEADGRSLRLSLSIGAAYAEDPDCKSFEDMSTTARRGLEAAMEAGGARIVEWKPSAIEPNDEVAELQRELAHRTALLKQSLHVAVPEPSPIPSELTLAEKLAELLASATAAPAPVPAPVPAPEPVISEPKAPETADAPPVADPAGSLSGPRGDDLQRQIQELMSHHNRQIDVLERRIGKLSCSLDATEGELQRMALLREVDGNLGASIMVDCGSEDPKARRGMLDDIFKANVELYDQIASRASGESS